MAKLAFDEALEVFRACSLEERVQFLNDFYDSLRPSEKHALHKKLESDNYYVDILGSLPREIALQVAEELDPKDVISLRRVSTRWKAILTTPHLARKVAEAHYSKRSDFPSYSHLLQEDPLSALQNIAFKQHAGETGLFRLRTGYDFGSSNIPRGEDSTFVALNASVGLEYAIFNYLQFSMAPATGHWYLVDLNKGQSQVPVLLLDRQREALDKGTAHVGTHCAAAITLSSSRAIVWDTNGDLIRDFRLLHEGEISISSSDMYLCVRNEHAGTDYSDYYLVNLQTKTLKLFEKIPDFVKAITKDIRTDSVSMMIIGNQIIVAAVPEDDQYNPQVFVSWLAFNEVKGTITETATKVLDHEIPHSFPNNKPHSITFERGMNTTGVDLAGLWNKTPNIWLTILPSGTVSISWKCLRPEPPQNRHIGGNPTASFGYSNSFYNAVCTRESLNKGGVYSYQYSLMCYRKTQGGPFSLSGASELGCMNGKLEQMMPTDKSFAVFYRGGVYVYDWLGFDEFMELRESSGLDLGVSAAGFQE
ncbi:hypothetical protein TWF718_005603 [Orbilia javanica]|uniref:F-box domain-containing protein n=1 Tax=Orbilia javanica TaxID=47235 RepID=A0AAN8MV78_9PEZI